ncbi:hypothetical protein [Pseudomonas sp. MN1F]|uniref:hypothetical protein n=1 Tax=Pseudomonas sp. MN1F TaxID=1366632 RepID=UPI00128F4F67|nr:hypothetical protein [Pseudomonas sp. MN1F]MQG93100.1 hypothetical protein [Pseudomonas sp. MN1F]
MQLVKLGKPTAEVEDASKLLQATVNSTFYKDGKNYTVTARFIRLTGDDQATIHIRNDQGDEYFSTLNTLQSAFDHATDLDIFMTGDEYRFVWEKQVFSHEHPTEITGHALPP